MILYMEIDEILEKDLHKVVEVHKAVLISYITSEQLEIATNNQ